MTASPELIILDVGHGNSALLIGEIPGEGVVIDCPPGGTLLSVLEEKGIKFVNKIVISHSDADHVGGVVNLLMADFLSIGEVLVNSDSKKASNTWLDFRHAVREATTAGRLGKVTPGISSSAGEIYRTGKVGLKIVGPSAEDVLGGVGGKSIRNELQSANSLSVVAKVTYEDTAIALFTGDLDVVGLNGLLQGGLDCAAKVLVFPHHGGAAGSGAPLFNFAKKLTELVRPELVVFSIGRGVHSNPQPEILSGVRAAASNLQIACTQLSDRCAAAIPATSPSHLNGLNARGKSSNSCCAGTISIALAAAFAVPQLNAHQRFVSKHISGRSCK